MHANIISREVAIFKDDPFLMMAAGLLARPSILDKKACIHTYLVAIGISYYIFHYRALQEGKRNIRSIFW